MVKGGDKKSVEMELKLGCNLQCRLPFYNEMYSGCLLLHAGFSAQDKHVPVKDKHMPVYWERAPLREIFDFQQIHSVLIRYKKSAKEDEIKGKDSKYCICPQLCNSICL